MDTLTTDQFKTSEQKSCETLTNCTGSVEFQDGPTPCASQDGQIASQLPQPVFRASRSLAPASSEEKTTSGICSQSSANSSKMSSEIEESEGCDQSDTFLANKSVAPSPATGSQASAKLQRLLEMRLKRRFSAHSSLEFELRWKGLDLSAGPPICRLRAVGRKITQSSKQPSDALSKWHVPLRIVEISEEPGTFVISPVTHPELLLAHPTSGSDSTGLPTPETAAWRTPDSNQRGGAYTDPEKVLSRIEAGHQINLEDQAVLVNWTTPTGADGRRGNLPPRPTDTGVPLDQMATLVSGWPTPLANKLTPQTREDFTPNLSAVAETAIGGFGEQRGVGISRGVCDTLTAVARQAVTGWATPMANPRARSEEFIKNCSLLNPLEAPPIQSWTTPSARDWKDTPGMATTGTNPDGSVRERNDQLPRQAALASGPTSNSSLAPTGKRGALNPHLSAWLQSYPKSWIDCAVAALSQMKAQKIKQRSSKPSKKRKPSASPSSPDTLTEPNS